jgi:TldD protein
MAGAPRRAPVDPDALASALDDAVQLARGLDAHWEVRGEAFTEHGFDFDGQAVRNTRNHQGLGVGVRVVLRGASGYAQARALDRDALRAAVEQAEALARAGTPNDLPPAGRPVRLRDAPAVRGHPRDARAGERLVLLHRALDAARAQGELVHAAAQWGEWWGTRVVVTRDGGHVESDVLHTGLMVLGLARGSAGLATGLDYDGGCLGLQDYEGPRSPEELGARAGRFAREQARAEAAPAGRTRALLDPALAGVLAHESFGHLAEHDLVDSGWSVLQGRVGETLASPGVGIVDTGMAPHGMGVRLPADDEAMPSRDVRLVEGGVLRGFLHARLTASAAGAEPTGNARAVDTRFAPVCRMRNTYFLPGSWSVEEALEEVGDGVYACGSTGGESRSDGNFAFQVTRAYRVRGGEVAEPLREASITGNILDLLRRVRGAGRELGIVTTANGGCGKWGQWPLFVGYGGPHLVLDEALLGGQRA